MNKKQIGSKVTKEEMAIARILQTISDCRHDFPKRLLLKAIIKIAKTGLVKPDKQKVKETIMKHWREYDYFLP